MNLINYFFLYIFQPEKRFILKVWRKLTHDLPQCRLSPSPLEDAVVGFTAIDLSIFLSGMQTISGWYNIMDFSSRVNGQIKVDRFYLNIRKFY